MVRLALPVSLALMAFASPAHATTERATVAVSLRVEPTCAAKTTPLPKSGEPTVGIDCATQPPSTTGEPAAKPHYVVRTVHRPEGTVVSFEF
jgi:hypothetical protein